MLYPTKFQSLARYVRDHGFIAVAHRDHVLVGDRGGNLKVVRTFGAARQWLGY